MTRGAVIWDMDGVLADSGPLHLEAWRRLASERGRGLTDEEFRQTFGMRNDEIVTRLFGDLPPACASLLAERKEGYFREAARAHLEARAGARRLLTELGNMGFLQALASSAPTANVELVLDTLGLRDSFQAVVTGADVRKGKPNPEVFLLAADRLGVPPERCVVVEDAVVGVQAAKAANMRCIAVTSTNTRQELRQADLVVDSLDELQPEAFFALLS